MEEFAGVGKSRADPRVLGTTEGGRQGGGRRCRGTDGARCGGEEKSRRDLATIRDHMDSQFNASVPAGEKGGGAGDDGVAGGGRRAGAVLNPCLNACGGEGRRGRGRWSSGRRETRRRRGGDGSSGERVREQSRPSGFVT